MNWFLCTKSKLFTIIMSPFYLCFLWYFLRTRVMSTICCFYFLSGMMWVKRSCWKKNCYNLAYSLLYIIIIFLRPSYTTFRFIICDYIKPIKLLPCMDFLWYLCIICKDVIILSSHQTRWSTSPYVAYTYIYLILILT